MKNIIIKSGLCISLLITSAALFAQPGPPGPGAGGPIDGGAIALVVGAAYLSYRRSKEKKK